MDSCEGCKYSQRQDIGRGGKVATVCRRYPPAQAAEDAFPKYPQVSPRQWCGEFVRQKDWSE